jgi:hypothetical protein
MVKIIDTLLGKSATHSDEDYMELDLASYEESGGRGPALLVKIATISDLKEVAKDVNGDIIGLGDQRYVVLTPMSVKISRDKIGA